MPTRPTRGVRATVVEIDTEVFTQLKELAAKNRRTLRDEYMHALRRHLATPPVITIHEETPRLPPASIESAPPPRKRGRPRKS